MKLSEPLGDIHKTLTEMITNARIFVWLNTLAYAMRGSTIYITIGKIGMAHKLNLNISLDKTGKGNAFAPAFIQVRYF